MRDQESPLPDFKGVFILPGSVKCNKICHVFYLPCKVLCDGVTSQKRSTKFNSKKSFSGVQ